MGGWGDDAEGRRYPWTLLAGYAVILTLGLASLAAVNRGEEVYPSLVMPGFSTVAESGGQVRATEVLYTVTFADGSSAPVAPDDVLPDTGAGYVAALRTLQDPRAATSPETSAWLAEQLPDDAVRLDVEWHSVHYDTHTRARTDLGIVHSVSIDLGSGR